MPAENPESLASLTDYGLGTFKGKPLVLVNPSMTIYHRHDHHGKVGVTTFTENFARNDWGARPCKVCWPSEAES